MFRLQSIFSLLTNCFFLSLVFFVCVELIDEVGRGKSIALMTSGKDENSQQFRLKKNIFT